MKSRTLAVIGVVVFAAIPVAAYDHPLGSHAIREAYFIGAGNYVEGLAGYTKSLLNTDKYLRGLGVPYEFEAASTMTPKANAREVLFSESGASGVRLAAQPCLS
jgi:hypothetical protein